MSFDIDWSVLDHELAVTCQRSLNQAFQAAQRPSFLAEVACTEFRFGDTGPDVELVDIRDVWSDFIEADEEADAESKETSFVDNEAAWRGADSRRVSPSMAPSVRSAYSRPGSVRPTVPSRTHSAPHHFYDRHGPPTTDILPPSPPLEHAEEDESPSTGLSGLSLQLHLRLTYSGALRLGIRTSLLVNHPAAGFLQLPLNVVVTAVAFKGTLVVAYQGSKRRVHLSLLDPGPGPAGAGSPSHAGHRTRPAERVLTDLLCESEVGQTDKQVLRNVGKVEKFVLEVVRGALEDEIIWPMFQTIALGKP